MITYIKSVLGRLFSRHPEALEGMPASRRMKTYSAQSGYVYQYYYEGHRANTFLFTISSDRKIWAEVRVALKDTAIQEWETSHRRELSPTERYAIAKMALFQAFDNSESPAQIAGAMQMGLQEITAIIETLDL